MVEQKTKESLYELAEIGEEFGPLEIVVDDHRLKAFAFMQDDYRSWHFSDSPFGRRIGHAAILANELLQLYHLTYDEYGASESVGLHTEEQLWFHQPVFEAERVTLKGVYVDKYERRGKGYVVMEAEARGADERLLVRHRGTEIMRIAAGNVMGRRTAQEVEDRVTGEYSQDVSPAEHAHLGIRSGTQIVPLVKHARPDQMATYSMISPFSKNIHTDYAAAQAAGLRQPVMQGQQQASFVSELLTGFFGASWFTSGWEKVKFISPVYAFDDITVRGVVTGTTAEEQGTRVHLEVWVEDSSGTMTAAGWASALADEAVS